MAAWKPSPAPACLLLVAFLLAGCSAGSRNEVIKGDLGVDGFASALVPVSLAEPSYVDYSFTTDVGSVDVCLKRPTDGKSWVCHDGVSAAGDSYIFPAGNYRLEFVCQAAGGCLIHYRITIKADRDGAHEPLLQVADISYEDLWCNDRVPLRITLWNTGLSDTGPISVSVTGATLNWTATVPAVLPYGESLVTAEVQARDTCGVSDFHTLVVTATPERGEPATASRQIDI